MSERLKEILSVLMDVAFKVKGSDALPIYKAIEDEMKAVEQAKKIEDSQKVAESA